MAGTARHYGMDWLRIGAFGLLILYHIGMIFSPWSYHINVPHPQDWVEIPLFLANPWRLSLLFLVSGYASRALWNRARSNSSFLLERTARLLPPLLFGIAVIVPPQSWVELTVRHGYRESFVHFWRLDYFRFDTLDALWFPTWNHLWFVAYLLVYTLALGGIAPYADRLQPCFDRLFRGARAILIPTLWLLAYEFLFFRYYPETQALIDDWSAHLFFFPTFVFGFGLAQSRTVMQSFADHWRPCAAVACGCFVTMATLLLLWPNFAFPSEEVADLFVFAKRLESWTAIAALIGIAERYWNRDHRWRPMLTEAVFPFYLIHQTLIVVAGYWLLPLGFGAGVECTLLLAATVGGCWLFYGIGREITPLRPLIGLRVRPPTRHPLLQHQRPGPRFLKAGPLR